MVKQFESYEQVAQYLLDHFAEAFGLDHVEGKQTVLGQRSGTTWEIDAKGVRIGNDGFLIVECRRHTKSGLKQEELAAVAYRINDTGAKGGIVVSPLELQEGAKRVAAAENIVEVKLNADATKHQYILSFLNKVMVGLHDVAQPAKESLDIEIVRKDGSCEKRHLT